MRPFAELCADGCEMTNDRYGPCPFFCTLRVFYSAFTEVLGKNTGQADETVSET